LLASFETRTETVKSLIKEYKTALIRHRSSFGFNSDYQLFRHIRLAVLDAMQDFSVNHPGDRNEIKLGAVSLTETVSERKGWRTCMDMRHLSRFLKPGTEK
jgi:hypothetical protein